MARRKNAEENHYRSEKDYQRRTLINDTKLIH